jgi:hypothetical protein
MSDTGIPQEGLEPKGAEAAQVVPMGGPSLGKSGQGGGAAAAQAVPSGPLSDTSGQGGGAAAAQAV